MNAINSFRTGLVYFLIALVSIFSAFPILYMAIISLKDRVLLYDPSIVFFVPTLENYKVAIYKYGLIKYLQDSTIISLANVVICLFIGILAGYALQRFSFLHKEKIELGIVSSRMLPSIALVLPFYIMGLTLGLLDTYSILVIIFIVFNLPFVVLMIKSFFENIPQEFEEAAMVDGCSRIGALIRVVLPQMKGGIFATGIISFIFAWNEFTYALFLTSIKTKYISTAVIFFKTERGILWGEVSALGVVAVLPVLILCVASQKYLLKGVAR